MNKTKIDWCDYSWNPVVGCKNNCWYCYGKRIAKRFFKDNPNYEPKFYPERLEEPFKVRVDSKIFVCSMADLFGDWVSEDWIWKILGVAMQNPQHTFQFLTKNPKRYLEFDFPENCWLGLTIDKIEKDTNSKINILRVKKNECKIFISFEPLCDDMGQLKPYLPEIDLVIVGAMTGMGKENIIPKKEWIDSIKHPNIFYKDNIKKYLK